MPFLPDLDVDGLDDRSAPYYWHRYGESDGQQGNPRRILDDSRFQYNYDIGFSEGTYFRNQLNPTDRTPPPALFPNDGLFPSDSLFPMAG